MKTGSNLMKRNKKMVTWLSFGILAKRKRALGHIINSVMVHLTRMKTTLATDSETPSSLNQKSSLKN